MSDLRAKCVTNRLTLAFTVVSLFAANVAGQKQYKRPPVNTPDTFRGANTPPDPKSIGDLKFFEVFKDPQLQKLIETAFVQNYDLHQAIARIEIERANLGLTRANQFPIITGSTDLTKTRSSNRGGSFPAGAKAPRRTFGEGLLYLLTLAID